MKRRDFREEKQPLVMIIPMIDIMLFLLVFFMLSTIYMVQTHNFNVDLPQSESAQKDVQPDVVAITVLENGEVMYEDGKVLPKNLPQLVNHALSKNVETIFVLYGDKDTRYEEVVGVLELLKKSGVRHVSIATEVKN